MFHGTVLLLIIFVNLSEIYSAPANVDNSKTVAVYNEYRLQPGGNYNYKYKLSDGQAVDVEGKLNDVGGNPIYRVKGSYTFEGTDGKVYTINYTADENGYKPSSERAPAFATGRPDDLPIYRSDFIKPGGADEINPRTIAGTFG